MNIRTLTLSAFVVALACGCASTVKVTKVDDITKDLGPGVYYTLPKTVILVELPITNTVKKPGRFFNDPKTNYFGTNATFVLAGETNFTLGNATLRTAAIPDANQIYHVKIDGGYFEDRGLQIELDENGLMSNGSAEADNRVIEFTTQTLETGASIAGKVLKFGGKTLTPTGSAQEYLEVLEEIQNRRLNLLTGHDLTPGFNIDGDGLKIALDELKALEKAITEEFLGKSKTTVWIAKLEVTPAAAGDTTLLKLHAKEGISHGSFINDPPKGFVNESASATDVKLAIVGDTPGVAAKIPKKSVKKSGFFYRHPAASRATVTWDNKTFAREDISVAQFGPILSLPSSTGSKNSKQQITLFKATGALNKVSVTSKSWDPAQISKAGTAAGSVIEGTDELARLERERKILEERKKIQDAQKALQPAQ